MKIARKLTLFLSTMFLTGMVYTSTVIGSPFIEEMPKLTVSADDPNLREWTKPGVNPSDYNSLMIVQPIIFLSEKNKYKGMQPDQMKYFADKVAMIFISKMGSAIEITTTPGPGVLIMNMAITELKMKKKRGILSFTPIGAVAHAATSQTEYEDMNKMAEKINMTDANLEIEFLDGASGERVAIRVLTVEGKQKDREEKSWYALGAEIEELADRFAANYSVSMADKR